MKRRKYIQMIHVHAEVERNTNSAVEENRIIFKAIIKMKEVNKVVLLDELKQTLTAYEEPLKDLRDSL